MPILKLNFSNPFSRKFEFFCTKKTFHGKCASFFNSYWGLKLSLSWRTMSLLFADVVSNPIFSSRVFAAFFHFAAMATFFHKILLSFSLTHKLVKFYVYEVALIIVHSGLHEKQICWGGGRDAITPMVDISCFRGQYK